MDPPRTFLVGNGILIKDCGTIALAPDEQVTFLTDLGGQYDVVRKDWGFYATPSLNGRLLQFGLRGVLVQNQTGRYYVLLVEQGREESFQAYLTTEKLRIVHWLDSEVVCRTLDQNIAGN
jgi:hypothetical protein